MLHIKLVDRNEDIHIIDLTACPIIKGETQPDYKQDDKGNYKLVGEYYNICVYYNESRVDFISFTDKNIRDNTLNDLYRQLKDYEIKYK